MAKRVITKITFRYSVSNFACGEGAAWFKRAFPKGLDLDDTRVGRRQVLEATTKYGDSYAPSWAAWLVFTFRDKLKWSPTICEINEHHIDAWDDARYRLHNGRGAHYRLIKRYKEETILASYEALAKLARQQPGWRQRNK